MTLDSLARPATIGIATPPMELNMSETLPPEAEALLRAAMSSYVLTCLIAHLEHEHPGLKENLRNTALNNLGRIMETNGAPSTSREHMERAIESILR